MAALVARRYRFPMGLRKPRNWFGLKHQFPRNEAGAIDWKQRPHSKTWSLRRLGRGGARRLIEEVIDRRQACSLATSGQEARGEDAVETSLSEALKRAFLGEDGVSWIADRNSRWLVEISPDTLGMELLPRPK